MNNFCYDIPTKICFGRGQITHLADLRQSGTRVLMVYGGGSILRSGLHDEACRILEEAGLTVFELPGVEPNPKIQRIRDGVEICRREKIEMVLAVGGGSCIDSAKLIAAGAKYEGDPWEMMVDPSLIQEALPIYCVLTIAATGSEMDNSTVVSDLTIHEKRDIVADALKPTMSICDPTCTFTVSRRQTAAGAVDIMSHVLENYFTNVTGAAVQAHLCEAILKTVIENAPIALREPDNYDARANLMWCSSLALNNLLIYGAEVAWCVHPIEYGPSAFYDMTHGVGLAILTPVWMEYVMEKDPEKVIPKFAEYGRQVWGIGEEDAVPIVTASGRFREDADRIKAETGRVREDADWIKAETGRVREDADRIKADTVRIKEDPDRLTAEAAVCRTAEFFRSLGMPSRLSEEGITDDHHFRAMAETAAPLCEGCFVELTVEDIEEIYRRSL